MKKKRNDKMSMHKNHQLQTTARKTRWLLDMDNIWLKYTQSVRLWTIYADIAIKRSYSLDLILKRGDT